MTAGRFDLPCELYIGAEDRYCGQTPTRRYLQGRRCKDHRPLGRDGKPAPEPNPDRTMDALMDRAAAANRARREGRTAA